MNHFYEYLDEADYFIRESEDHLGILNLGRMRLVFFFSLLVDVVFTSVSYMIDEKFPLHAVYLAIPAALLLLWRLTKYLEKRSWIDFPAVRLFSAAAFTLIFLLIGIMELFARPGKELLWFPLAMVAAVAFYLDYFKVIASYECLLTVLFLVFDFFINGSAGVKKDALIILPAFCMALICYFMILCTQTDSGRDSRALKQISKTDLLTGLYNKVAFEIEVKEYLAGRLSGTPCTLFIFDFDNFKHVNDNYGHQTGDEVLKFFGSVLHASFRSGDIIGRVGGDEFMVLMTGAAPAGLVEKRCVAIQQKLRDAHIGKAGGFSASIGIAQDDGIADFGRLYQVADAALYQAKENGKACYVKYNTSDNKN